MNSQYAAVRHLLTAPGIVARTARFIGEDIGDEIKRRVDELVEELERAVHTRVGGTR